MKNEIIQFRTKIRDPEIVSSIIQHGAPALSYDIKYKKDDGEFILIFKRDDNGIPVKRYKKMLIQFLSPKFLRDRMGRTMDVYQEYLSPEDGELFRIRIAKTEAEKKIRDDQPRFNSFGKFVIPPGYISNYLDERCGLLRATFNRTNEHLIDTGYIYVYLSEARESLSYPMRSSKAGLITRSIKFLEEAAIRHGKKLSDFTYQSTTLDPEYKHGKIIFRHSEGSNDV